MLSALLVQILGAENPEKERCLVSPVDVLPRSESHGAKTTLMFVSLPPSFSFFSAFISSISFSSFVTIHACCSQFRVSLPSPRLSLMPPLIWWSGIALFLARLGCVLFLFISLFCLHSLSSSMLKYLCIIDFLFGDWGLGRMTGIWSKLEGLIFAIGQFINIQHDQWFQV